MDRVMNETRRQCLFAMLSAIVVVICVCAGVTMNLTTVYDENFDHMGIRTFCMFTVNSNILTAATMAMVIPYTVDGLRKHNYHLPHWIMLLVYAGVTAVTLTFLISLFILAPVKGFRLMFSGSRFFLHGLCPIQAFIAFCFFMSEQRLRMRDTVASLIPVLIYAIVYYVMVVVLGVEKGGWEDFYGFATRVPVWIPAVLIMPLTFGISSVIRLLHNRCFDEREREEAAFFKEAFADADVRKLVAAMARVHGTERRLRDILIPARVISILMGYDAEKDCTFDEACHIYLKEYLAVIDVMDMDKLWI